MFPIIFKIGPVTVYSYGFMLALGVMLCYLMANHDAKPLGIKPEIISDLAFWIVLGGIVGSRIFYILLNLDFFIHNPFEIIMLQHGGLAFQGGLVFGFITTGLYLKWQHLPFWKFADFCFPYVAFGQSIGRLGCFLNGCCYGRPVAWGIYSPIYHTRLHPTQLYSSVALMVIFLLLRWLQSRKQYDGQIFVFYLILASCERIVVQFFRADYDPILFGMGLFQIVSLVFLLCALLLHGFLSKKKIT